MLIIKKHDMLETVSANEIVDQVESVLVEYVKGDLPLPAKQVFKHRKGIFEAFPCLNSSVWGVKIATKSEEAEDKYSPRVHGDMIIGDLETGKLAAILDGEELAGLCMAGLAGVGVRWLSSKEPHGLGIIGVEPMAFNSIHFACLEGQIAHMSIYDENRANADSFAVALARQNPGIPVRAVNSSAELLSSCQTILLIAPSEIPVLPDDWSYLKDRTFIDLASNTPDKLTLPRGAFELADTVYVDVQNAADESGNLITALRNDWILPEQIIPIGDLIDEKGDNTLKSYTFIFNPVGMVLLDLAVGHLIYEMARFKGAGTRVES